MKSTILFKFLLTAILFCNSHLLFAQHPGVAISTTGAEPDSTAMLDIISNSKGFLLPRVFLMSTTDQGTIPGAASGLMIFNSNDNMPGGGMGIYYNSGEPVAQVWQKLGTELSNNVFWSTAGNSGLNNAGNYIGTKDSVDLIFKTKSQEMGRFTASGALFVKGDPVRGKVILTGALGPKMLFLPGRNGAFRAGFSNTEWNDNNVGDGSVAMGSANLGSNPTKIAPQAISTNTFAFGYGAHASDTSAFAAIQGSAIGQRALAMGLNAKAHNRHAIALGRNTSITAEYGVAIGYQDTASGTYSVAMGSDNRAIGTNSFAIGFNNKISGDYAFGIGSSNAAQGDTAIAMGILSTASGLKSIAIGDRVRATRRNSIAMGEQSVVITGSQTAENGVAIGYQDTVSALFGLAMGAQSKADGRVAIAIGSNAKSSGRHSVALGSYTLANADYATAFGAETQANAIYSTAFGYQSEANANHAIAFGNQSIANNPNSVAFGFQNKAFNSYATAFGYIDTASGQYSTAMGARNEASGDFSTATGHYTNATGDYSFSGGWKTTANGTGAAAFGVGTEANGYGTFVVGRYNDPIDNVTNCLDPVFVVGIGDGSGGQANDRQNGLVVDGKGNLFIKGALFVEGNTNINNPNFGNVPMDCTYPSDIRLKKNIESLGGALGKINNLQPITYVFKDQERYPAGPQIGFSAQELQKEFPQLVKTNESTGFLGVDYQHMSAVTVQAIKEQQEIIKSQDKKLSEQQQRIIELKNDAAAQKRVNEQLNDKNIDLEKRIGQLEKMILDF